MGWLDAKIEHESLINRQNSKPARGTDDHSAPLQLNSRHRHGRQLVLDAHEKRVYYCLCGKPHNENYMTEPEKRISVRIPESLHRKIKIAVAVQGTTISDMVRELLMERLRDLPPFDLEGEETKK